MGSEKKNDIALVRVNKRICFTEYIKPACLQTHVEDEGPNVVLTALGWGLVAPQGKYKMEFRFEEKTIFYLIIRYENVARNRSVVLQKVDLKTVPLSQCNKTLLEYNQHAHQKPLRNGITEGQYCTHDVDPNGKKDTCEGDSGGPLQVLPAYSTTPKVVGIVSFGVACGSPYPSIYTRVAHYLDWIESNVWPNDEINPNE